MRCSFKRLRIVTALTALGIAGAVAVAGCGGSGSNAASTGAAQGAEGEKPTYTIGIDIPFHPIWDYLEAKASTYFANKPYNVKFKVLDATTQVPAFGAGQLTVMTTTPSFIPRVLEQYKIETQEFFPLARWTIGAQILVPTGSPYKTLQSLKGQPVAIAPLSQRFGAEEAAIEAETGESITSYFHLEQTEAAAQQLTLGRVKAAIIEAPSTYPLLQSGEFHAIWSVHDAFLKAFNDPAVVNGGFIARASFIKSHAEFIENLVAATQDIWNKYNEDPEAVNAVASEVSGIPPAQLATVGKVLDLNGIPASQRCISQRDVETWTKIFPLLAKSGFLKANPSDPARFFDVTCK